VSGDGIIKIPFDEAMFWTMQQVQEDCCISYFLRRK